ncbi:hypothetical protein, partial [Fulvivirga aurantia]|uniref:hypothetical protein n=1 Tax=Fulvivirga aurantia TaxID=2529383 RepID=UPI0016273D30
FTWQVFAGYLNVVVTGLLITHLFRKYVKTNNWISFGIFKLAGRILLGSLILAIFWNAITLPINHNFFAMAGEEKELTPFLVLIMTFNLGVILVGWSLIYFTFQFFFNFKK